MSGSARPFLEVADRGNGRRAASTPSASSSRSSAAARGTGLGLFLARELAQTNGATLLYEPRAGGGSVFRLVFADPAPVGNLMTEMPQPVRSAPTSRWCWSSTMSRICWSW